MLSQLDETLAEVERLQASKRRLEREIDDLAITRKELVESIEMYSGTAKEVEGDLQAVETRRDKMAEKAKSIKGDIVELETEYEEKHQTANQKFGQEVSRLLEEARRLEVQIAEKQISYSEYEARLREQEKQMGTKQTALSEKERQLELDESRIMDDRSEVKALLSSLKDWESELSQIAQSLKLEESQVKQEKETVSTSKRQVVKQAEQVEDLADSWKKEIVEKRLLLSGAIKAVSLQQQAIQALKADLAVEKSKLADERKSLDMAWRELQTIKTKNGR